MSKWFAGVLIVGMMLAGIHAIAADIATNTATRFNDAESVRHSAVVAPGRALDMALYRAHSQWSDAGPDCLGFNETRPNAHAKSQLPRLAIK